MQFLKIFMITIYGNLRLFWTGYSATAADTEIPISYGHYMLKFHKRDMTWIDFLLLCN